jgi:hypothetical protein
LDPDAIEKLFAHGAEPWKNPVGREASVEADAEDYGNDKKRQEEGKRLIRQGLVCINTNDRRSHKPEKNQLAACGESPNNEVLYYIKEAVTPIEKAFDHG